MDDILHHSKYLQLFIPVRGWGAVGKPRLKWCGILLSAGHPPGPVGQDNVGIRILDSGMIAGRPTKTSQPRPQTPLSPKAQILILQALKTPVNPSNCPAHSPLRSTQDVKAPKSSGFGFRGTIGIMERYWGNVE